MTGHRNLYIPILSRKNMDKKLFLLGFASIFLLVFAINTISAYHGHGDYINSYSYSSSRSYGYADNIYTRSTDYHRNTISRYLSDGTFERTTTYIRTTREPSYYSNRYYDYRPNYRGYEFGNYYNRPFYNRISYNRPYY